MNETVELVQGNNTKWMDLENSHSGIYILKFPSMVKILLKNGWNLKKQWGNFIHFIENLIRIDGKI